MKQKDVGILFVATLAILLSVYYQGSYHGLRLVWVHPIDASLYENGHFPLEHERLYLGRSSPGDLSLTHSSLLPQAASLDR
jgi:hypothetical protein